jgi:hypothetical protein
MNKPSPIIKNEKGMALVICLMIMVVMALIATGVTTNSTVEIKISGNQRNKAVSFNNADVGTGITPEIIEQNLDAVSWESSDPGWVVADAAYLFLSADNDGDGTNDLQILVNEDAAGSGKIAFATIASTLSGVVAITGDVTTSVDVGKTGGLAAGNAIQMAAGYEGLGKGAGGGGYHAYYLCESNGSAGNNTTTASELYYRHVAK